MSEAVDRIAKTEQIRHNMKYYDDIVRHRDAIFTLAKEFGVIDIRVFGSVARGDDGENSDVDFLILMEKDRSYFDLMEFQEELSSLLGRKCDVVSEGGLHWFIRDKIIAEARPV